MDSGTAVLEAAGEIDLGSAPLLAARLDEVLVRRPAVLVVDLAGVEFMGAAGLNVLVRGHQSAARGGTALHLIAGRHVRRVVTLCGLAGVLRVHDALHARSPDPNMRLIGWNRTG
ncbi:STAS domain-containing protein [Prauserella shujinwangii]|uniref:STAS domain-containing protein n=1 Tax=Prauserella shujinwangii TaxID=1453103 RepID=UPI0015E5E973|nr:STAS domain-containing protein [Prauserella shujinwangii]